MTVVWFFRKTRALGNFSIENSFQSLLETDNIHPRPVWLEAAVFNNGWMNRLRIIVQASKIEASIFHITGDITFSALAWPKWRKTRPFVVLTIHDIGIIKEGPRVKSWIVKKIWLDWPLHCVDQVIVVSDTTKAHLESAIPWFPINRIFVIPSVVPQHFKPRVRLPQNTKPVALHIGLADNKNLERHAEALRNLNVHLRIIGEPGPDQLEMLSLKAIDFSCISRLNDDEMQSEYANADFLLFASTLEGFGMPIIEANMVGVPVITSDLEPMRSVAGEAALLCNPLDISSIRSAVERILHDKPLQDRLIQNGFENAKRFSPEKSAQLHQELYKKLLDAQP